MEPEMLKKAGYPSRKTMKKAMYHRAKVGINFHS